MKVLSKLNFIFDKKQKRQLFILGFMILIGAGLELIGVTLLLPFINLAIDPNSIYKNNAMYSIYQLLNCKTVNYFLAILAFFLAFFT